MSSLKGKTILVTGAGQGAIGSYSISDGCNFVIVLMTLKLVFYKFL